MWQWFNIELLYNLALSNSSVAFIRWAQNALKKSNFFYENYIFYHMLQFSGFLIIDKAWLYFYLLVANFLYFLPHLNPGKLSFTSLRPPSCWIKSISIKFKFSQLFDIFLINLNFNNISLLYVYILYFDYLLPTTIGHS